ncbi:MAG: 2-dehydropantoate 2-reductase [Gammaproteobacteria bacterium]|nr:2-dehydropantoate 2-reductase [Gammaproteobacteria bacterium]
MKHWYIAGSGAIGSLAAANLVKNNCKVTPIVRHTSQTKGRSFQTIDGQLVSLPAGIELTDCKQIEHLFVPLKAYNIIPFLTSVSDKIVNHANIVLCHNGMGTIEQALKVLPKSANLYFCTTSNGAFKQNNKVVHAGQGDSYWKKVNKGSEPSLTAKDFNLLFNPIVESNDLDSILWQKLLVNCAINPLTAIHKVKNGELLADKYQPIIENIVAEVCTVARSLQVALNQKDMLALVNKVIKTTANNTSSMRQDVENKTKTEIDYINGYISQQAAKLNIQVPENARLLNAIKQLENY